jgi:transposase-like protein
VITSIQRRRHWTTQEKVRLVEETDLPGQSVSLVAHRHGLNANQLFTWRRLIERLLLALSREPSAEVQPPFSAEQLSISAVNGLF